MKKIAYISLFVTTSTLSLLAKEPISLENISVKSSTIDSDSLSKRGEVSSSITLDSAEIEKINPQNASDILRRVAGITLSNTGTDSLKVHIRGIDNQMYMGEKPGVAIVIDGVPVQETSGKINIDLDNIESIKVVKGGASYLYGNDAISGAVIITTKRPKGGSKTKLEVEYGSFDSKRALISTNQGFDDSALQVQASYRDSDGYWDDAYTKVKAVNGKYRYFLDSSTDLTFGLDFTDRESGDGNTVQGTDMVKTDPKSKTVKSYSGYYDTNLIKSFLRYSLNIDNSSNLMVNLHKYRDDKEYKTARFTKNKSEIWDQEGLKSEYRKSFNNFAFMVGTDIQNNQTDEVSTDVIDGKAPRGGTDGDKLSDYETKENIYALYTELKYQATKDLTATANLRYDRLDYKYINSFDNGENVSPDYSNLSYRVGLNYNLNQNTAFFTSLSTGFRTPTVTQISLNREGLREDPTKDIPNDIDLETTQNIEFGVRGDLFDSLSYEASIYQLDRDDYIGRIAGSYVTSDNEDESFYNNVGSMRSRGLEVAVGGKIRENLSFHLAYTYLDATFKSYWLSQQLTENTARYGSNNAEFRRVDLSGNRVPRTSNHNINLTADYKINNLTISPEIIFVSSYYIDEVNKNKQDGHEIVNLRANYQLSKNFEIFGKIDNLLDKDYYQFMHLNSSAIADIREDSTIRVAPPRAFYTGLRYRF